MIYEGKICFPIPKYPGYYATKCGRILSTVPWRGQRIHWMNGTPDWQARLCITINGDKRLIHQLILETFVGSRPNSLVACHNNGNNQDNRLENLRWDTQRSNVKDSINTGTHTSLTNCGEGMGSSKLTETKVRWIRYLYKNGLFKLVELGDIFGVHFSQISNIVNRKQWTHI